MVKFSNRKRVAELTKRELLVRGLVTVSILATAGASWGYWHFIHSNTRRVFWSAIDNAMQSRSFSRQTIQGEQGQSFDQRVYVSTTPHQVAKGTNEVAQVGDGAFHVITGTAGSPTKDYVKYDFIQTDQKDAAGKPKDFKGVLGVWGESSAATDGSTSGQLYNQSVLGVVPFSNINLQQRKELMAIIRDKEVYKPNFGKVTKQKTNGRPTYIYDVTVSAESYITMLKKYASFVGLTQLESTNPADYKDTQPLQFQFVVDVWTGQLIRLRYAASAREEVYGSQGIKLPSLDLPKKTIPMQELQQKVQAIE